MEEILIPQILRQSVEKPPFFNPKRRIVFIYVPLVMAATMFGAFVVALIGYQSLVVIFDVVMIFTRGVYMLAWCKIDAREREYKLSKRFPLAVVLFGFLAPTYYLLRSRGLGQGLISVGWMILYASVLEIVLWITVVFFAIFLISLHVVPKTGFN
jgi:hypothetical protein